MTVTAATRYTRDFVRGCLPEAARSILEIGCGRGELASVLKDDGFEVVAIDSDPECVAAAQAAGVDARIGEWPTETGRQFDAVLFTRSLHHVHDLGGGLAAARGALRPGGLLIVEDLRIEGGSARGRAWFTGLTKTLFAAGAFRDDFDLAHMLAKIDVDHHEHELHASAVIAEALGGLGSVAQSDAAYYFRYLEPELRAGLAAAEALLDQELSLIEVGAIDPLGTRFVAA